VVSSLAVELDGVDHLVLLQQMLGVLGEQGVDLADVVGLGQVDGHVPLVQVHTAVNGRLDVVTLSGGKCTRDVFI